MSVGETNRTKIYIVEYDHPKPSDEDQFNDVSQYFIDWDIKHKINQVAEFSGKGRARLDISLTPTDVPLSLTRFEVSNGISSYESAELSAEHSIIVDMAEGSDLFLSFTFRPSSEIESDTIELNIAVSVTGVPYIPNNNPSGTDDTFGFVKIPISSLELLSMTWKCSRTP